MRNEEQDSGRSNPEGTAFALRLRDEHERKLGSHERRRALQDRYGFLQAQDLMHGLMAFGFECRDGWLGILEDLFAKFDEVVQKEKLEDFSVLQVKEKFGTLRVYVNIHIDEIDELIEKAEKLSETTCEECGRPGTLLTNRGWYVTLCPACADKG